MQTPELLYGDLTYLLNGIFFSVHNELGKFCNEAQYGDAIEAALTLKKIPFERERILEPMFAGEHPGRNRVDFIVADAVVIEIKAKHMIERSDMVQLLRYLQALNFKLGILVNFHQRTLTPKRVVNPDAPIRTSTFDPHQ